MYRMSYSVNTLSLIKLLNIFYWIHCLLGPISEYLLFFSKNHNTLADISLRQKYRTTKFFLSLL